MIASSVNWNVVLNHYTDQILDFALNILVALIIVGVGFKLSKWLVSLFRKGMEKRKVDLGVVTFSCSFLKIALRCIVIFMAVERLGVKGTSIVALFGSAGVAVGLALQGSLSNIAGGVLLMSLKPFQVGDYIVVDGTGCEGEVKKLAEIYGHEWAATAPAAILLLTKKVIAPSGETYYIQDFAAAAENILIAATAKGYATTWIEGQLHHNGVAG